MKERRVRNLMYSDPEPAAGPLSVPKNSRVSIVYIRRWHHYCQYIRKGDCVLPLVHTHFFRLLYLANICIFHTFGNRKTTVHWCRLSKFLFYRIYYLWCKALKKAPEKNTVFGRKIWGTNLILPIFFRWPWFHLYPLKQHDYPLMNSAFSDGLNRTACEARFM